MTSHHYPLRELMGDYARTALGLLLTAGPLLLGSPGSAMIWVLASLALLFAAFGLRTALRQRMRLTMTDAGIETTGAFRAKIDWERLDQLRLRYYSSRRGRSRKDGNDGWMQAIIGGNGQKIRIDSALTDFDNVALRALEAARAKGVALDEATQHNFKALGAEIGGAS